MPSARRIPSSRKRHVDAAGFWHTICLPVKIPTYGPGSHTFRQTNGHIPIGMCPSLDVEISYIPYPSIAQLVSFHFNFFICRPGIRVSHSTVDLLVLSSDVSDNCTVPSPSFSIHPLPPSSLHHPLHQVRCPRHCALMPFFITAFVLSCIPQHQL